jgi:choline dehydrogenase
MSRKDLIVVGAGSAGCVLASRLTRDFGLRVTLVEAPSIPAPKVDRCRPARWLNLLGSGDDWGLMTEPSPDLAGRTLGWPRGRGLGGSSRINAMIWFPPTSTDIQNLCDASSGVWGEQDLAAALASVETQVATELPRWLSDPSRRFMDAACGMPGATSIVYRRLNRTGRRWLPSDLLPTDPEHCEIVRATVDHLIFDGEQAIGVRAQNEDGSFELRSSHGVVLSAGTVATPGILMRSGLGDRNELRDLGIDARVDLPAVGQELCDHLIMPLVFERHASEQAFRSIPTTRDLARWQMMGAGPVASNIAECGGLFDGDSVQLHVTPTHYLNFPRRDATPMMTIGVNVTQPKSRGRVRLASRVPTDAPILAPNYFADPYDQQRSVAGIRLARKIANLSPLAESIRREAVPGEKRTSDEALIKSTSRYAQTLYHPTGTCRLGSDAASVVDPHFALRGISGLWVADASLLPNPTIANPNATIMTLAWMAAEQIGGS